LSGCLPKIATNGNAMQPSFTKEKRKPKEDISSGSNLFLSYINAKALIQERNKLLPFP